MPAQLQASWQWQRLSFFACLGALGMRGGTPAWKSTNSAIQAEQIGGSRDWQLRLISGALQSDQVVI
jgi:hypothetical protein